MSETDQPYLIEQVRFRMQAGLGHEKCLQVHQHIVQLCVERVWKNVGYSAKLSVNLTNAITAKNCGVANMATYWWYIGLIQQRCVMPRSASASIGDRLWGQFPVPEIYLGTEPAIQVNPTWPSCCWKAK